MKCGFVAASIFQFVLDLAGKLGTALKRALAATCKFVAVNPPTEHTKLFYDVCAVHLVQFIIQTNKCTKKKYIWFSFVLEAVSTPEPQCGRNEKIPMTPLGIEPATLRFEAQCLNQMRQRVLQCVTSIGALRCRVRSSGGARDVCLLWYVLTGSGTHTAFSSMGTGAVSRGKATGA